MTVKSSLSLFVLVLVSCVAEAQVPVVLNSDDVYFVFRPAVQSYTSTGSNIEHQAPASPVGLCGFSIHGNHNSWSNPRVEWDLNIAELMAGTTRVAGISAGTFDVVGKVRKPRSPIVELGFLIKGESEAISAEIVGSPNADNGIKAMLDTAGASKLFTAFSDTKLVTISLKYADNTADLLQIRGWHDWRSTGGGKNSYFNACLRGYIPDWGIATHVR